MPTPTNERERHMEILRAALPYTAGSSRHAMELLLQTNSLLSIARQSPADLEACDTGADTNPEDMLLHIQEFCTPKESDLVQMLINFMKADRLFKNYREFSNAQAANPDNPDAASSASPGGGNPLGSIFQLMNGLNNPDSSGQLMEFLMTQLSSDQKDLFSDLKL